MTKIEQTDDRFPTLQFDLDYAGRGKIFLDGKELLSVRGMKLTVEMGGPTICELQMIVEVKGGITSILEPPKLFKIIVNGNKRVTFTSRMDFFQLLRLDNIYVTPSAVVYTVTYSGGPASNPEGSMLPGDSVDICDGMIFNVTNTSGA